MGTYVGALCIPPCRQPSMFPLLPVFTFLHFSLCSGKEHAWERVFLLQPPLQILFLSSPHALNLRDISFLCCSTWSFCLLLSFWRLEGMWEQSVYIKNPHWEIHSCIPFFISTSKAGTWGHHQQHSTDTTTLGLLPQEGRIQHGWSQQTLWMQKLYDDLYSISEYFP